MSSNPYKNDATIERVLTQALRENQNARATAGLSPESRSAIESLEARIIANALHCLGYTVTDASYVVDTWKEWLHQCCMRRYNPESLMNAIQNGHDRNPAMNDITAANMLAAKESIERVTNILIGLLPQNE